MTGPREFRHGEVGIGAAIALGMPKPSAATRSDEAETDRA